MSGDFQIKAVVAQGGGNQTIKSSSRILASTAPGHLILIAHEWRKRLIGQAEAAAVYFGKVGGPSTRPAGKGSFTYDEEAFCRERFVIGLDCDDRVGLEGFPSGALAAAERTPVHRRIGIIAPFDAKRAGNPFDKIVHHGLHRGIIFIVFGEWIRW